MENIREARNDSERESLDLDRFVWLQVGLSGGRQLRQKERTNEVEDGIANGNGRTTSSLLIKRMGCPPANHGTTSSGTLMRARLLQKAVSTPRKPFYELMNGTASIFWKSVAVMLFYHPPIF